jgi:predicted ATPase
MNNWYVITGGPSTGKTTLLKKLNKLGYSVIPEAARTLIDESIQKGISVEELRADERKFQEAVARMKEKIESELDPNELIFFDRGMHDSIAYMRYYNYKIDDWLQELSNKSVYKNVFLLKPLKRYEKDYARVEDDAFRGKIHALLKDAYSEFKMEPISLKPVSVNDRLKIILEHIEAEQ